MRGAVDRLRKYAGINGCPMAENVTKFTADRQDMWLYTLKIWMEKRSVTLDIKYSMKEVTPSIVEACSRIQENAKFGNG